LRPIGSIRNILPDAASPMRMDERNRVMVTQTRKRNHRTWQKLLQPIKLNPRKRADCVVREALCTARPGTVRAALEQAVAVEVERMRALQENEDAVRAFRAATELHIALCDQESDERPPTAVSRGQPLSLHPEDPI
jgi:hypothetical protein